MTVDSIPRKECGVWRAGRGASFDHPAPRSPHPTQEERRNRSFRYLLAGVPDPEELEPEELEPPAGA